MYFSHLVDVLRFLTNSEIEPDKKFAQLLPINAAKLLSAEYKLNTAHIF